MHAAIAILSFAALHVVNAGSPWSWGHSHESSASWNGWGGNIYNTRFAQDTVVNTGTAKSLALHCQVKCTNGESAAPTVSGDMTYYPTWGGLLVALNYKTCQTVWETNITQFILDFAPITTAQATVTARVSRTSPYLYNGILYIGTQTHALVLAVNASTGAIVGHQQINTHPMAVITQSPMVYEGTVLVGCSSDEESAAASIPGYQCCSFAGNMMGLTFDAATGTFTTLWDVGMLPEPRGNWSGVAIWGSTPPIDRARSQVFVGTGNVYSTPLSYQACIKHAESNKQALDACAPTHVYQEAVIAFDIGTGRINWLHELSPIDAWTVACISSAIPQDSVNCPPKPGPDADFGMAPAFVSASAANTPNGKDTVVIGQKNGNLYALSAEDGTLDWATSTSPDGVAGGLSWGVAVDDSRVYFTAINFNQLAWKISPSQLKIKNSAWGAANLTNGTILWDTQVQPKTSLSEVPPTVANDVIITGRTSPAASGAKSLEGGTLMLLDAASGDVLNSVDLDSQFHGGIAVSDQYLLFGSGYTNPFFNTSGSFYVFKIAP